MRQLTKKLEKDCLELFDWEAGLSLDKLMEAGVTPEDGEILVTGASGGVGSMAVALLVSSCPASTSLLTSTS